MPAIVVEHAGGKRHRTSSHEKPDVAQPVRHIAARRQHLQMIVQNGRKSSSSEHRRAHIGDRVLDGQRLCDLIGPGPAKVLGPARRADIAYIPQVVGSENLTIFVHHAKLGVAKHHFGILEGRQHGCEEVGIGEIVGLGDPDEVALGERHAVRPLS